MKFYLDRSLFALFLIALLVLSDSSFSKELKIADAKGFNVDLRLKEADFSFLAKGGASVLRVSFPRDSFLNKDHPWDYNEEAFRKFDNYIFFARKYSLKLIVDPHTFPGFLGLYSTKPSDAFWNDVNHQNRFVEFWGEFSRRYSNDTDVIYGLDLLNEPSPPADQIADECKLLKKLYLTSVRKIRVNMPSVKIFVEFAFGMNSKGRVTTQHEIPFCTFLGDEENLIYSFHMYTPGNYTHQGVKEIFPRGVLYSDRLGRTVARDKLLHELSAVRRFQLKTSADIFVGEFGVSRYAADGYDYVALLIDIFKEYQWGWAFHSFRESDFWNPELGVAGEPDTRKLDLILSNF